MRYIAASIILAFTSFINLILAIATSKTYDVLHSSIWDASNKTNTTTKVMPLINSLGNIFWILFILFAVAAITWFVLGSHREEYETYGRYYEREEIEE